MDTATHPVWFFKKDEMKANAGDRRIFIARDWQSQKGRMVKQFASVTSHEALLQYIQQLYHNGEDACLYELIRYNTPCKLYFDIEWTDTDGDDGAGVLSVITNHIDSVLKDISENARKTPSLRTCEVLKSSRTGKKKGSTKHSFHIVYPRITVANNTVAIKHIVNKVHSLCESVFDKNPVDMSVYTRDRLFRAPLCWKGNDTTRTALRFADGKHPKSRILSCFVTNVSPPGIWIGGQSAAPTEDTHHRLAPKPGRGQPRDKTPPNTASLAGCKVDVHKLEKKILAIIREHGGMGHVRFYRTDESSGKLIFRLEHGVPGREEPCMAHGIGAKITHKHDNQLITTDANGIIRVICPHKGKCDKARHTLCRIDPRFFMTKL